MPRKATPDLLADLDVSQETTASTGSAGAVDAVAVAMGDSTPVPMPAAGRTATQVPLDLLQDNPYQPRQRYNGIEELAENIKANGLLQAPVARSHKGAYQLAFGHRRLRAYRLLTERYPDRWKRMPVILLPLTDEQMALQAWSENHNREDVSAVEEARLYQRLSDDFGLTQQQIADKVGKSRSAVANTLRLLQLPEAAQAMIDAGQITERHGRELLRLAGAPAWLDKFIKDLAAEAGEDRLRSVSYLTRNITQWIRINGQPMTLEPVTMADRWDNDVTVQPAPWPLDAFAPRSPDVRGECAGCAWLVKFDREPAGRCTDGKCYDTKDRIWKERERERQKAAAVAAAAAAFAPPSSPEPAEGNAAAPAELAEAEAKAAVGWSKNTAGYFRGNVFGASDTPAGLITRGLCGAEQCDCFALRMLNDYELTSGMVRPDPENAPNAVYVCENTSRLRAQRNRLEEIEKPEKAAARKQAIADKSSETRETKQALRELWEEIGAEGLAGSLTAMRTIAQAARGYSYSQDDKLAAMSVGELWEWLFWLVAEKKAQVIDYEDGNRRQGWVAAKAQALAETLRAETGARLPAPRPAHQPGPGDSQATRWQDGWTVADDEIYRMIKTNPGTHLANLDSIDAPRVLLRLIEDMGGNKPLRSKLWQRHNQLVSQETPAP